MKNFAKLICFSKRSLMPDRQFPSEVCSTKKALLAVGENLIELMTAFVVSTRPNITFCFAQLRVAPPRACFHCATQRWAVYPTNLLLHAPASPLHHVTGSSQTHSNVAAITRRLARNSPSVRS